MRNIHIENSYIVWDWFNMIDIIDEVCWQEYGSCRPELVMNRSYFSMVVEWWLHNIGYYVTKPFCFIEKIKSINLRCKHVDLEEWDDK